MERYLIVSDMDGSLAGEDHEVQEITKTVIRKLLDQGHLFYIATGRMKGLIENIAKDIDERVGVIGSNGGIIELNNTFDIEEMDHDQRVKLYDFVQEKQIPTLFFSDKDILYTEDVPDFFAQPNPFNTNKVIKRIDNPDQDLKSFQIINALLMANDTPNPGEILMPARQEILDNFNLTVTSSNINNLEVYAKTVSKGNAVRKVMHHHNIKPENVITFGDGFNDVSMFKVAKTSVAMGNAPDEVKSYASHVTETNIDHGVAQFLMDYFK